MPLEPLRSPSDVAYHLKRYLSIKSAYSPDFSPDDRRIAYLSDLTGVPQMWMTDLEGDRAPQQITLEDERVGFVSFAPKSDRIAFGIDRGANANASKFKCLRTEASPSSSSQTSRTSSTVGEIGPLTGAPSRLSVERQEPGVLRHIRPKSGRPLNRDGPSLRRERRPRHLEPGRLEDPLRGEPRPIQPRPLLARRPGKERGALDAARRGRRPSRPSTLKERAFTSRRTRTRSSPR